MAKGKNWTLAKKIRETKNIGQKNESGKPKHARNQRERDYCASTVGLLSQEDQPQTHCSTRHISKETVLH